VISGDWGAPAAIVAFMLGGESVVLHRDFKVFRLSDVTADSTQRGSGKAALPFEAEVTQPLLCGGRPFLVARMPGIAEGTDAVEVVQNPKSDIRRPALYWPCIRN
jgi:hypothetical protein